MFFEASSDHCLAHDPFKAIVAPRPIGWISTINTAGIPNLAPYSFFNAVSSDPPMVAFSSEGLKDSVINAKQTGEFVCNFVSNSLIHEMNKTSASLPHGQNEFSFAGLEESLSNTVRPPRVALAAAALECRVVDVLVLKNLQGVETGRYLVVGQVVGTYINDKYIVDGKFDTAAARPVARCGYRDYALVESVFSLTRPDEII